MEEKLTKEEFKTLQKFEKEIETIVRNASASSLSAELREIAIQINERIGIKSCNHCNSSLYRMITRVYSMYTRYKTKNTKEKK